MTLGSARLRSSFFHKNFGWVIFSFAGGLKWVQRSPFKYELYWMIANQSIELPPVAIDTVQNWSDSSPEAHLIEAIPFPFASVGAYTARFERNQYHCLTDELITQLHALKWTEWINSFDYMRELVKWIKRCNQMIARISLIKRSNAGCPISYGNRYQN